MIDRLMAATALALLAVLPVRAAPSPGEPPEMGGRLEAEIDGRVVAIPALRTEVEAEIQGDLATVTVRQVFENPGTRPMDVTYLFPLNREAAVYGMRMEVGDEVVHAVIREKAEARRTYEAAKGEGKAAALLTQHRPNMFTQEVANLMPGLPVEVTISYVQAVPKVDGAHELVVPLVVGPRYQPAVPAEVADLRLDEDHRPGGTAPRPAGRWEIEELPDYPPVIGLDLPETLEEGRVSVRARLVSAVPVEAVWSDSHAVTRTGEEAVEIALAEGRTVDNRDFVLRWKLGGEGVTAGLLAHRDGRGGFFSLMIEPPERPAEEEIARRELVFVLDTSGSMDGLPIEASKVFMEAALAGLRPDDHFRILNFSDRAAEFSARPVPATPGNVRAAMAHVRALQAGGGTEMASAIEQAFAVRQTEGTLRLVVFLTDGYIGNEAEVLRGIRQRIGQARIYALGVGTAVNRYLLDGMAKEGRGQVRYIDPTEDAEAAARALAARIGTPVLTDIRIDWGGIGAEDVAPGRVPDLFAGDTIRVQGRYAVPGRHRVVVEGRVNGRPARLPLEIELPEASGEASAAIPLVWARGQIAEAMGQVAALSPEDPAQAGLKARVTDLGLTHSLATRWTSFVAVSERVVNARPDQSVEADVPLPMPEGVPASAYPGGAPAALPAPAGVAPRRAEAAETRMAVLSPELATADAGPVFGATGFGATGFAGHSTPEPETWGGLVLLLLGWLGAVLRRRAARRRMVF